MLVRSDTTYARKDEWERLFTGVVNNSPEYLRDWKSTGSVQNKRVFRNAFGKDGDRLRYAGWRASEIGQETKLLLNRFSVKLGQALYYKHANRIFEGIAYTSHINMLFTKDPAELSEAILEIAPRLNLPTRSGKSLESQFVYRYNYSDAPKAFMAVSRFCSDQFVFNTIMVEDELATQIDSFLQSQNNAIFSKTTCKLKNRPAGMI